jgi:hypothetical protein
LGGSDPLTDQGGVFAPQEFILFEPQSQSAYEADDPINFNSMTNIDICKNVDYFLWKAGGSDFSCHDSDVVRFVAPGIDPTWAEDPSSYYSKNNVALDPQKTAGNVAAKQQYLTYSTQSLSDAGGTQTSLTLDISKFSAKMTSKEATTEIYNQLYPLTPVTSLELMSQRMATIQSSIKPYVNSDGAFDLNKFALSANNADLGAVFTLTSGQ